MSGNYWSWLLKRFPKKGKFQPVKHLPDGKLMQSCSELSMAKYSMKVFSESVSLLSDCSLICLLTHSSTSRHSEPWFINDISSFDWFSTSILAQYSVSRLLLFTISANWTNGRKCVKILGKKKKQERTFWVIKVSICWIKSLFLAIPGKDRTSMQLSTVICLIRWLPQILTTRSIFRRFAARKTAFTCRNRSNKTTQKCKFLTITWVYLTISLAV